LPYFISGLFDLTTLNIEPHVTLRNTSLNSVNLAVPHITLLLLTRYAVTLTFDPLTLNVCSVLLVA